MNTLTNTNGKPSGTKFWFSVASAVSCLKFLVSDTVIKGVEFGAFDGTSAAMLLGVLGGTYAFRRQTDSKNDA